MFLVNSRLDHFSAPTSRWVPLSRSYGVNLPSSLAMIHSSTLGSSPHPPVSVYGTGRLALRENVIFLQVCLPALSGCPRTPGTVGFQSPYGLQRAIPSARGSVTSRSHLFLQGEYRNVNRFAIGFASRLLLSPRLTLIRLTLFRKPGGFGVHVSLMHCRYLCLHLLFQTLQHASRHTFDADWNAPLPHIHRCTCP